MSKKMERKICQHCTNSIYIGEGDYYCDEEECIVLTDFLFPTENFLKCKGERFESDDQNETP